MRTRGITLAAVGVLALAVPALAGEASWIHVKVDEVGAKAETVRVNLPLSVIETAAPLVSEQIAKNGKIAFDKEGKQGLDKAQLQSFWNAIKNAPDAEFVTVESDKEHVRVAKSNGQLIIKVREDKAKADNVTVEIPLAVADALLSGPTDQLDFVAAINALKRSGQSQLITVDDKDSKVRIWIDDRASAE
jgi:hypothetical protein